MSSKAAGGRPRPLDKDNAGSDSKQDGEKGRHEPKQNDIGNGSKNRPSHHDKTTHQSHHKSDRDRNHDHRNHNSKDKFGRNMRDRDDRFSGGRRREADRIAKTEQSAQKNHQLEKAGGYTRMVQNQAEKCSICQKCSYFGQII